MTTNKWINKMTEKSCKNGCFNSAYWVTIVMYKLLPGVVILYLGYIVLNLLLFFPDIFLKFSIIQYLSLEIGVMIQRKVRKKKKPVLQSIKNF